MLTSTLFTSLFSAFLIYLLKRKKRAEAEITMLSQIVEQSPMSIITLDEHGNVTYVNAQFEKEQKQLAHPIAPRRPNFFANLDPTCSNYQDIIDCIKKDHHWRGEIVRENKAHKVNWQNTNIYPLVTDSNQLTKYVVISQDITRQKEDEKQLRLASTVFHTATEAVMICDESNNIVAVNRAFTEITGFQEQEALGKSPSILNSGHHDEEFYLQMFEQLNKTDQWQGEICNRRKSGEVYYEWLSITAMRSDSGAIEAYVSLFSDITKRKQAEDKIIQQANYDALTGLANRNLFTDRLRHALDISQRECTQLALMFIDLDGFKQVNDSLGHSIGDLLLQQTAKRLTHALRKSDTVTRLGGDEFAILLADNDDIYAIERVACKLLEAIAEPFQLNDKLAYVTASIGIAIYPDDSETLEGLLSKADSAMYKAKNHGKNNFQFFTKEMDIIAHRRRVLEQELRRAVIDEAFHLEYQPIHESHSHIVSYAEALIRWQHPEKGLISPAQFIPLAEELGLINKIGLYVLRQACSDAAHWQTLNEDAPGVSVNVSSIQFQQNGFIDSVCDILNVTGLAPHKLLLELTESLIIDDDNKTLEQLTKLKELGVQLAIDDFGTGYSSLSYLKRFPVDKIKIDRSFISDVTSVQGNPLVDAILSIASSLEMEVVAEGVETQMQLKYLFQAECDFIQGYIYSKPLKDDAFCRYFCRVHEA